MKNVMALALVGTLALGSVANAEPVKVTNMPSTTASTQGQVTSLGNLGLGGLTGAQIAGITALLVGTVVVVTRGSSATTTP